MSIVIDDRAREVIRKRQSRGQPASIDLRVTPLFRGGSRLSVNWGDAAAEGRSASSQGEDATVRVDRRIGRYAQWNDVVISAQRVGPFEALVLEDPLTLLHVSEWERAHPGLSRSAATPRALHALQ